MLAFALLDGILFYPYTILITLVFLALPFVNARGRGSERSAIGHRAIAEAVPGH